MKPRQPPDSRLRFADRAWCQLRQADILGDERVLRYTITRVMPFLSIKGIFY